MQLADLLVSYNQVEGPKKSEIKQIELPYTRYQRMLDYLDSKKERKKESDSKPAESTETAQSDGFVGWKHPESNSSTVSTASSSRWNSPYDGKRDQWITDMTAAYKRQGLNDNAIKNLIAKNALESGWGRSAQGDYNYGNLTTGNSWTGRYVQGNDHNADGEQISQRFRAYDSMDDYVKDEIQFLTNLYEFNQDDDFDTFIGKLQGGNSKKRRYAEDKQYSDKVRSVYNSMKS